MLKEKKILLGVTGSISVYKSLLLVRLLIKSGADVKVIMSKSAQDFVTPLSFSTLSKNAIISEFSSDNQSEEWNNHVELALWADVFIIAPATANTLGKMANGICDNVLLATYLSAKCPVFFAPAMDLDMYQHPTTKSNIKKLQNFGNIFIEAGVGELASGLLGAGRVAEPEDIIGIIRKSFNLPLKKKKILVTAGPTYEAIDPVRFIGNHSSGKMGFAIAEELARRGANVTLVCGPNSLSISETNIHKIEVTSAQQMYDACMLNFDEYDAAILSAAVADYTPVNVASEKIKKEANNFSKIELQPTKDILATLGSIKSENQKLVGFALETENELENAKGKLERKNLDFIVLNSLKDRGAGFKGDNNKITIVDKNNNIEVFELQSKKKVAIDIVDKLQSLLK